MFRFTKLDGFTVNTVNFINDIVATRSFGVKSSFIMNSVPLSHYNRGGGGEVGRGGGVVGA